MGEPARLGPDHAPDLDGRAHAAPPAEPSEPSEPMAAELDGAATDAAAKADGDDHDHDHDPYEPI